MGRFEMEARTLLRSYSLEEILEASEVTPEEALEYLISMGAVDTALLQDLVRPVDEEGT